MGKVRPRPGLLVQFRGDLQHEVQPFTGGPEGAVRASLVCEQYAFEPEALARIPAFRIQSKAGFAAYLDEHRERSSAKRPRRERQRKSRPIAFIKRLEPSEVAGAGFEPATFGL